MSNKFENGVLVPMDDGDVAQFQADQAARFAVLQARAIETLTAQVDDAINTAFSHTTRDMLNYLYASAQTAAPPRTNQAAYCQQVAEWGAQCLAALQQALVAVQAATTEGDLLAIALTLPPAPAVTLAAAMQIAN